MNPPDTNPSGRPPSLYQMSTQRERKGGGGLIVLALVVLLLAAGGAYYFLKVSKPPVLAAVPVAATPAPAPVAATPPMGYNSVTEQGYIDQADKAFVAVRQPTKQAFDDALKAYGEAGGVSPKGLTSKGAVVARRDLIAKLIKADDDFAAFVSKEEALYKEQLSKTPLNPHDVENILQTFQDKAKSPLFIKIREAQHVELQSGDNMMAALEKNYGGWSVSPAGKLSFKRPAEATAYNGLAQKFNADVQALNKLQDEFRGTADPNDTTAPGVAPGGSTVPVGTPSASPAITP